VSDRDVTAEVVDQSEQAAWEALEKEVADQGAEGEPVEQESAEAEAKDEPAQEPDKAAQQPIPYEELDKRYKQLQGALGEERGTRKQMAERVQQMEQVLRAVIAERQAQAQPQAPAPKVPTIEEDPIGFFQHKVAELERQVQESRTGTQQTVQQVQQAHVEQQFWGAVERSEQAMRQANPDYDPAVTFLEGARVRELEIMVPDNASGEAYAQQMGYPSAADMRVAILNNDRIQVARQALQMGMSPAELYFSLAKQRGFQSKPATPAIKKPTAQSTPIEAARKGAAAARSLSGGTGASDNVMTPADLAELYLEDPERADAEFRRMKNAGLLG
jgi:hypothetical protein